MTKNSPIIATKFRPQLMVIPDPTVAQEFLCILDSTAAEFTFQSFDDDKNRKDLTLAQICHGSFEECCDWACSMSARGAGVFVAINRTDFKGRKAKNIIAVRYYIADLDGVPLENLQRLGIRPNILVQTSDEKFHCYWRITGAPLETYSEIETRLNNLLAADSSVKDLPRVLRVPGFPHQKDRSNPFMVRMIDHDALSFTSVEFEAALRAAETLALSPRATGNRSSASERTKEPKGLSMPEWKLGSPPDYVIGNPESAKRNNAFAETLARLWQHQPPPYSTEEALKLTSALNYLKESATPRDTWMQTGLAIYNTWGDVAYHIFDEWSKLAGDKYDAEGCVRTWASFKSAAPRDNPITTGSIIYNAREAGWVPPADLAPATRGVATVVSATAETAKDEEFERLVEKISIDAGAPFTPDMLERLAALQKDDRAAFETLRARLKKAGCRITVLDDAIAEENSEITGRRPTQADVLIDVAKSVPLFHTPDGTGFADIEIDGHRETWPIRSSGFRDWMTRRYYERTGGAPSAEAMQSARGVIQSRARFDGTERAVYTRVGNLDGLLYLDLGDKNWQVVEISPTGWKVIKNPPVRFRRAAGMQALSVPTHGGSIEALRSFLNVQSDEDFVLAVAWALAVLRNCGPYPVLVLSGEQGSAKSTFSAILRSLLDPNTAPLRALPREDRDLFIAASNGHVLAFDNLSGLPPWISDTLCRLATGGGFAVRQLYSDQDEVLFEAARPVILNGIEDIVTRPDLADRAVVLTLEPIPDECRRPEAELWADFEAKRPLILGALLDAVVKGLAMLPQTKLEKLPRMADFALWATACETALWTAGTFSAAYCGNRDEAVEGVINADPIAAAVRDVMETRAEWTGTATDLLGALALRAGERMAKARNWPASANKLAGRLRRVATGLRKIGIDIVFKKEGRSRTRIIQITATPLSVAPENAGMGPSASSVPFASMPKSNPTNEFPAISLRTVVNNADGSARTYSPTVRTNPLKTNAGNGADGADATSPPQSGHENAGTRVYPGRL